MTYREYNCDGLIGPNHNYCGLSHGNIASRQNKDSQSNPKEAALQGLDKMKSLMQLGLSQVVLPPHERPSIHALRAVGFSGTDQAILAQVAKEAPDLLANVSSASAMWTANSSTVAPSSDTADGKVHFTPANLANKYHRAIEIHETSAILAATFNDPEYFVHHPALPTMGAFSDEGAANHNRFCQDHGDPGLQLFVYGQHGFDLSLPAPKRFPARQTLHASRAIARLHQLAPEQVIFAQQNPDVIDQGVFHNDVIAVANRNVLLSHETAFVDRNAILARISRYFDGRPFYDLQVSGDQVPIEAAVQSYLFNSQLVDVANGKMALIAPIEAQENRFTHQYLTDMVKQDNPVDDVLYFDLRQSMRNGGGPACLRLRVVLNEQEAQAVNPGSVMDETLYQALYAWVEKYYQDRLTVAELADPAFLNTTRSALDELTQILKLGSIYRFQQ